MSLCGRSVIFVCSITAFSLELCLTSSFCVRDQLLQAYDRPRPPAWCGLDTKYRAGHEVMTAELSWLPPLQAVQQTALPSRWNLTSAVFGNLHPMTRAIANRKVSPGRWV